MFLITLAGQLPTLSAIEVIKELLCFVWFTRNDPERLPSEGNLPTEMCSEPGPARALSIFLSVQTLLVSFFSMSRSRVGVTSLSWSSIYPELAGCTIFFSHWPQAFPTSDSLWAGHEDLMLSTRFASP